MIESKYTIEYVNPEDATKQPPVSNKHPFGVILGGLALAASAYYLITLPAKPETPEIVLNQKPTKKKIEKTDASRNLEKTRSAAAMDSGHPDKVSMNTLTPKVKSFEVKKAENKPEAISNSNKIVAKLKAQLLDTQQKNKELASELDKQIMENMELSKLLEDSLYKINKKDKSYIRELKKLEKKPVLVTTDKKSKNSSLSIKSAPVLTEDKKKTHKSSSTLAKNTKSENALSKKVADRKPVNANRVDLSTSSQVDAIIANLNNAKKSTGLDAKAKNRQQRPATIIEASKIKLQNDINHLINAKQDNDI